jgi:IS30 family transposase
VEEKVRIGDWEGDTGEGRGKTAYIATIVEKTSKLLVVKVMLNKAAATVNRATIRAFNPIADDCIKTTPLTMARSIRATRHWRRRWGATSISPIPIIDGRGD